MWKGQTREEALEAKRRWYRANKEKVAAYQKEPAIKARRAELAKEWLKTHAEQRRATDQRARDKRAKNNPYDISAERFMRRVRNHDLTLDQYHSMAEAQDFECAVCGEEPAIKSGGSIDGFVVDHDHVTGKPRALICPNCNVALGQLRDDPVIAHKAAMYLEKHHSRRPSLA
jgi:hypothetical protein